MPGGAANVARNLAALEARAELFGIVGRDPAAKQLKRLLTNQRIGCHGLLPADHRHTSRAGPAGLDWTRKDLRPAAAEIA